MKITTKNTILNLLFVMFLLTAGLYIVVGRRYDYDFLNYSYHQDIGCNNPHYLYPGSLCTTAPVFIVERKEDYEFPENGKGIGDGIKTIILAVKYKDHIFTEKFYDSQKQHNVQNTTYFINRYPEYTKIGSTLGAQIFKDQIVGFVFKHEYARTAEYPELVTENEITRDKLFLRNIEILAISLFSIRIAEFIFFCFRQSRKKKVQTS